MTLPEFYDELNRHDWFYQFSDDHSVWMRGESDWARLADIATSSPQHKALADAFTLHYYSGEPWGKPKAPKPERPKQ